MSYYQTEEMINTQRDKFLDRFDDRVGTEREVSSVGGGRFTITCCELVGDEVDICRTIENEVFEESRRD